MARCGNEERSQEGQNLRVPRRNPEHDGEKGESVLAAVVARRAVAAAVRSCVACWAGRPHQKTRHANLGYRIHRDRAPVPQSSILVQSVPVPIGNRPYWYNLYQYPIGGLVEIWMTLRYD